MNQKIAPEFLVVSNHGGNRPGRSQTAGLLAKKKRKRLRFRLRATSTGYSLSLGLILSGFGTKCQRLYFGTWRRFGKVDHGLMPGYFWPDGGEKFIVGPGDGW